MSVMISRDPFARTELHRIRIYTDQTCKNCGCDPMRTAKGGRFLFSYETQTDGGRKRIHNGLFCSKGCHDAYHS
jgi:hypothetical protein